MGKIDKFLKKSRLDEIPDEVYYSFVNITGEDKIKRAWKLGQDQQMLKYSVLTSGNTEYVILRDIDFEPTEDGIVIQLAPNFYGVLRDVNETLLENIQKGYVLLKVTKSYTSITDQKKKIAAEIEEIYPLIIKDKLERAKEIDEEARDDRIGALVQFFGYRDNEDLRLLITHRIMAVFTISNNVQPPVIVEFTSPNTGKTTFGKKLLLAMNWDYFNSIPSEARLIWNAKMGSPGSVVRHDGIIFDEFDKYTFSTEDGKRFYSVILTGMSHGIWSRSKGDIQPIVKPIPMIFFGNIENSLLASGNARDYLRDLLIAKKLKDSPDPFVDRVTSILIYAKKLNASDYVTGYQLPAVDLRAYLLYLNELVREEYAKVVAENSGPFEGRMKQHYFFVKAVLRVLKGDIDDQVVTPFVDGLVIS